MMEHIIYKTTNILNNRFYIGMHSTEDIDDGYLGSGRRIKAEIKKYGKDNFIKEIIEHHSTREALCKREAELVCEKLMQDPLCLNLKNGGDGGWDHIDRAKMSPSKLNSILQGNSKGGKTAGKITGERNVKLARLAFISKGCKSTRFAGKKHKDETKRIVGAKNSKHQTGEGNSQFGTCWVTNGGKPLKIKKRTT